MTFFPKCVNKCVQLIELQEQSVAPANIVFNLSKEHQYRDSLIKIFVGRT